MEPTNKEREKNVKASRQPELFRDRHYGHNVGVCARMEYNIDLFVDNGFLNNVRVHR